MAHHNLDSEDALEQATLRLFEQLGWQTLNCFDEVYGDAPAAPGKLYLGRETTGEVDLVSRRRPALERLNSGLPPTAITLAIEEVTRDPLLPRLMSGEVDVEGASIE